MCSSLSVQIRYARKLEWVISVLPSHSSSASARPLFAPKGAWALLPFLGRLVCELLLVHYPLPSVELDVSTIYDDEREIARLWPREWVIHNSDIQHKRLLCEKETDLMENVLEPLSCCDASRDLCYLSFTSFSSNLSWRECNHWSCSYLQSAVRSGHRISRWNISSWSSSFSSLMHRSLFSMNEELVTWNWLSLHAGALPLK